MAWIGTAPPFQSMPFFVDLKRSGTCLCFSL
jgi:hypothetical protein